MFETDTVYDSNIFDFSDRLYFELAYLYLNQVLIIFQNLTCLNKLGPLQSWPTKSYSLLHLK